MTNKDGNPGLDRVKSLLFSVCQAAGRCPAHFIRLQRAIRTDAAVRKEFGEDSDEAKSADQQLNAILQAFEAAHPIEFTYLYGRLGMCLMTNSTSTDRLMTSITKLCIAAPVEFTEWAKQYERATIAIRVQGAGADGKPLISAWAALSLVQPELALDMRQAFEQSALEETGADLDDGLQDDDIPVI